VYHYLVFPDYNTGLAAGSILVKDRKTFVEAHEMQFDDSPKLDRCQLRKNAVNSYHLFQVS